MLNRIRPMSDSSSYVLGNSGGEQARIAMQARILRDWTAGFLRAAPFVKGMHVLDVGCGLGDVSFLVGEIVGPTGSVLGIDRDGAMVVKASERAREGGVSDSVRFEQADAERFEADRPFDAVVGRYVLHHQREPKRFLHRVASQVRTGGLVFFHEFDFATVISMWPETPPLWRREMQILAEYYRRAGLYPDLGLRLTRTFLDAGLGWPVVRAEVPVGGEPGSYLFEWLAQTVRSLLPGLVEQGLAEETELEMETLRARLEAESSGMGCQLIGPVQYAAWAVKP